MGQGKRKIIYYVLISIGVVLIFKGLLFLLKKPQDLVLDSLVLGITVYVLSRRDFRGLKSEFQEMKTQVAQYVSGKDAEKFITDHKALRERTAHEPLRAMLDINLAAAFIDIKQYDNARKTLEQLKMDAFDKKNRKNALLNKIFLYYRMADWEQGDSLFDANFLDGKSYQGVLYQLVHIIRYQRGTKEGLRAMSEMNKQKENELYRELITLGKMVLLDMKKD